WHKQPWPYFFVNIVPTLFVVIAFAIDHLRAGLLRRPFRELAIALYIVAAILLPLSRLRSTLRQTSDYQEAMFRTGHALLKPDEKYFDGAGMLFGRKQCAMGTL